MEEDEVSIGKNIGIDSILEREKTATNDLNWFTKVILGYFLGLILIFLVIVVLIESSSWYTLLYLILLSFIIVLVYAIVGTTMGVARTIQRLR